MSRKKEQPVHRWHCLKRKWWVESSTMMSGIFLQIDIIEVLTDSNRPRKYWNDLKKKLQIKGYDELSEKSGQLKMPAKDGAVIPRDQMWFYSQEWQQDEHKVEQQIQEGQVKVARNKDELLRGLGLEEIESRQN